MGRPAPRTHRLPTVGHIACSGVNRTQLQAAVLACTMERDKLVGSNPTMLVAVPGYLASGGQLDPDFSDLLAGGSLGPSWGVIRNLHRETAHPAYSDSLGRAAGVWRQVGRRRRR